MAELIPQQDVTYRDNKDPTRRLEVDEVAPKHDGGRNVRGVLRHPGGEWDGCRYSCSLDTFQKVWEEDR